MKRKFSDTPILLLALVGIILLLGVLNGAQFFQARNIQSMAFQLPELGMLSLAMMVTMLTAGINLSIIASANLTSIIIALILSQFIGPDMSEGGVVGIVVLAIGAGLLVSIIIGLLNGFLIAYIDVSPILATLGTMILLNGVSIVLTKGYVISGFPPHHPFYWQRTDIRDPHAHDNFYPLCGFYGPATDTHTPGGEYLYARIKPNGLSFLRHR